MKIVVVSYSFTGNNEALAERIVKNCAAAHIKITEKKHRTNRKIIVDTVFGRTPKTIPAPSCIDQYDLVIFLAPIWLGKIASPLRSYLQQVKATAKKYAFFSISGGALGPNPKVEAELKKRTGAAPVAFTDMHIAGLLKKPAPSMEDTSTYHLSEADLEKLTGNILDALQTA